MLYESQRKPDVEISAQAGDRCFRAYQSPVEPYNSAGKPPVARNSRGTLFGAVGCQTLAEATPLPIWSGCKSTALRSATQTPHHYFPPHSDFFPCGHSLGNRGDCGGILPASRESSPADYRGSSGVICYPSPLPGAIHGRQQPFIPAPVLAEPTCMPETGLTFYCLIGRRGKSEARESTPANRYVPDMAIGTLAAGITF